MRNLIRGDVGRVLRRKSYWIILVLMILHACYATYQQKTTIWSGFAFMGKILEAAPEVTALVLGMVLFLGVFGDEMSSMTMITVIGRGLPRWKVILAKYFDTMILAGISLALYSAVLGIISLVSGANMTPYQSMALYLGVAKIWFNLVMELSVACMILFLTSNTALGVFAFLVVNLILPLAVLMFKMIPHVGEYFFPERYLCQGVSARVYTQLMLDFPEGAALTFLIGSAVYIVLPFALTALVYEKKELDF